MQLQPVQLIIKSLFWLRQQLSKFFLFLSLGEFKVRFFFYKTVKKIENLLK